VPLACIGIRFPLVIAERVDSCVDREEAAMKVEVHDCR
jgi:hypothetical protein